MAESGAPERKKRLLLGEYFASLRDTDGKARYLEKLSILGEPYSSRCVPMSLNSSLPVCLSQIFKSEYLNLNYCELLSIASDYQITVTEQQATQVESKTKLQANSRLWYQMRAGRITASCLKAACRTNLAQPSISLIMEVCHPEMSKFKTVATNWGCAHEKVAISRYLSISLKRHHKFQVRVCL